MVNEWNYSFFTEWCYVRSSRRYASSTGNGIWRKYKLGKASVLLPFRRIPHGINISNVLYTNIPTNNDTEYIQFSSVLQCISELRSIPGVLVYTFRIERWEGGTQNVEASTTRLHCGFSWIYIHSNSIRRGAHMYKYDSFLFKAPQSAFRTPHWYRHYLLIYAFYGYLYTGAAYCIVRWLVITLCHTFEQIV